MKKLKVGVIGIGFQGRRHAESYSMLKDAELVAICDFDKKKAQMAAKEFDVPNVYVDYTEMLENPEIEAVSVATPDHLHREPVVDSIKAGKHVLCEKPLATTLEDVDAMIAAWKQSDVKFMVSFENRWNPPFRNAKRIVEKGEIGQPIHIYTSLKMLSWASKSSPAFFLSVHPLDLCRWFTDSEISEIVAYGCRGFLKDRGVDTLDAIQSLIVFENGVQCVVESSWIMPSTFPSGADFEFRIIGSKGILEINPTYQSTALSTDRSYVYPEVFRLTSIDGYPYGFVPGVVRHFVRCVLEDKKPLTSPYDGRAATEAALAILESVSKNKIIKISKK
jgi:predicted dehydrogenase